MVEDNAFETADLLHNDNLYIYIYIYIHKNFKSNIDLSFSTLDICDKIDTVVYDETWGSDHFPICFNIKVGKNYHEKKSFNLKSNCTD